jgi:adenine phosphoribosyltransferase
MISAQQEMETKVKALIRDVVNFPKEGIVFKDISPVLKDPILSQEIVDYLALSLSTLKPDALVCLESRGFWYGMPLALALGIPMIPLRKEGKLPFTTMGEEYALEYGTAKIEMHTDALEKGWKVLVHDDLLATGGTAEAATKLVQKAGASVCGYSFLVELNFLAGRKLLSQYSTNIHRLVNY